MIHTSMSLVFLIQQLKFLDDTGRVQNLICIMPHAVANFNWKMHFLERDFSRPIITAIKTIAHRPRQIVGTRS